MDSASAELFKTLRFTRKAARRQNTAPGAAGDDSVTSIIETFYTTYLNTYSGPEQSRVCSMILDRVMGDPAKYRPSPDNHLEDRIARLFIPYICMQNSMPVRVIIANATETRKGVRELFAMLCLQVCSDVFDKYVLLIPGESSISQNQWIALAGFTLVNIMNGLASIEQDHKYKQWKELQPYTVEDPRVMLKDTVQEILATNSSPQVLTPDLWTLSDATVDRLLDLCVVAGLAGSLMRVSLLGVY